MANYATLLDCAEIELTVTEQHLADADVFVDLSLRERGFDPAAITLPNTALTSIAVAWAKRQAAIQGAIGAESPLKDKANQLEKTALILVGKLTREALGLPAPTGSAFGQISLGRG